MRPRLIAVLALMFATLVALAGPVQADETTAPPTSSASSDASAESGPTTTIGGTLTTADGPLQGVDLTVTAPDGTTQMVSSGSDGRWSADVQGTGQATVTLDPDSLPDGASLRDTQDPEVTITLNEGRPKQFVIYQFGDAIESDSALSQIPQTLYNGLYFGVILALGSLGLSVIFGTTGLTNFAHGELVTLGAVVTFAFNVAAGLPIVFAAILTVIVAAAFGYAQDRWFWGILRKRGTGLIAMMIVSIGLQFFLRNLFQFFTGGRTENYNDFTTPSGFDVLSITMSSRDLVLLAIAIALLVGVTVALQTTRLGRATRAVSDNPALAASTGIDVDRVIRIVWTIGAMLAGVCGLMLGFSQSVKFDLGAQVLLIMFAAITLGGLGSAWGAILGTLIVGVLVEMSTLVIPSELKNASALFVLIIILLVRPQGILGRRERIG